MGTTIPTPQNFHNFTDKLWFICYNTLILCVVLLVFESLSAVLPLRAFHSAVRGPKPLAWIRCSLVATIDAQGLIDRAYQKYSKNITPTPFLFTNLFWRTEVMLPPSHIPSITSLPDSVLSCQKALEDTLQAEYTLLGLLNSHTAVNQWHTLPVKALSSSTPRIVNKIAEEIEIGFNAYWGIGGKGGWKEIDVLETMLKVAVRAGNRCIFGVGLCRNEPFVTATANFTRQALVGAILIRIFPQFLRPIFGRLFAWPNLKNFRVFESLARPLIEQKLTQVKISNESTRKQSQLPKTDDILQWHIEYAQTLPDPTEFTLEMITKRLMVFNTAAVVSTAAAMTHLITDLFTMPPASLPGVLEELREEICTVLEQENDEWNMQGLNRMTKLDSTVKESMRLSSNGTGICARVVIPKDGVKLENGVYLPQGTTVSAPQWALHHDAELYPNPNTYHPFRFHERRMALPGGLSREQDTESLVSTTPENLTWGLGRHACPGRLFVAAEMKLVLAHILLNYDVEPMTKKPTQRWFGTVYVPSSAPFRVKRRTISNTCRK